jgi:hypothetical protein
MQGVEFFLTKWKRTGCDCPIPIKIHLEMVIVNGESLINNRVETFIWLLETQMLNCWHTAKPLVDFFFKFVERIYLLAWLFEHFFEKALQAQF